MISAPIAMWFNRIVVKDSSTLFLGYCMSEKGIMFLKYIHSLGYADAFPDYSFKHI